MRIGRYRLKEGRPAVMGIVNATPDSFSDGGLYLDSESAIRHALSLESDGADIIDVGGESTRPGAAEVSISEEMERVVPVIEGIRRESDVPVSIDTTKAAVAERALDSGADMINDVSAGRFDDSMLPLAAKRGVPICLMHMKGTPRTMQDSPQYEDLVGEIVSYLRDASKRAMAAGVMRDNIAVDPGIGFGKTVEDNLTIIRRLAEIAELGYPVLIGTSRKTFIGKMLDVDIENRLEGTLATVGASVDHGASILRVHNVLATKRFLSMRAACR